MRLPSLKYLGFDEEMYRGPQVLFGSNFLSDRIKAIFCRLALKKNTTEVCICKNYVTPISVIFCRWETTIKLAKTIKKKKQALFFRRKKPTL